MIDQRDKLARFFAPGAWRSSLHAFPLSGLALADRVRTLRPRFVVDAGCGHNAFKQRIPNLIGIDLVNDAADLVCAFADAPIRAESIDVVLALGSVNFGDEEDVLGDLRRLASWLRPGGRMFMRVNPGEPLADSGIVVYPWSRAEAARLGGLAGLREVTPVETESLVTPWGAPATRLTWVYERAASGT